jgi:hypothetical protein
VTLSTRKYAFDAVISTASGIYYEEKALEETRPKKGAKINCRFSQHPTPQEEVSSVCGTLRTFEQGPP